MVRNESLIFSSAFFQSTNKIMHQNTSNRIKAIGFLCALMVVAIHCTAIPKDWWDGAADIPRWIVGLQALGTDTLARLAVPWFFVISGFFLVRGLADELNDGSLMSRLFGWWRSSIAKRLLTLGVPYLLWNLIYYGFKVATGKYGFDGWHCLTQLTGCDFHEVPACGQFWYLRNILFYVFCAPVFVLLLSHRIVGLATLLILSFCWLSGVGYPFRYLQIADYSYILYFGTGVYIGLGYRWCVCKKVGGVIRISLMLLMMAAVCGIVGGAVFRNAQMVMVCNRILILSGLPTLWFYGDWILSVTYRWKNFYGLAFFIYAAHVILVSVVHKITYALLTPVLYNSVGYLLKIAVGVFGSIVLGLVLTRVAPRFFKVLCGGRS